MAEGLGSIPGCGPSHRAEWCGKKKMLPSRNILIYSLRTLIRVGGISKKLQAAVTSLKENIFLHKQ